MRILIVEEYRDLSNMLTSLLKFTHEVDSSNDGVQALDKLTNNDYDLVILEEEIPRISCDKIGKKLKLIGKNPLLIKIINKSTVEYSDLTNNELYYALLPKPFKIEWLVDIIDNVENKIDTSMTFMEQRISNRLLIEKFISFKEIVDLLIRGTMYPFGSPHEYINLLNEKLKKGIHQVSIELDEEGYKVVEA